MKKQLTREQLKAMPNRERIAALTDELNRLSPDMEAVKKLHQEMGDLLMEAINGLTPEDIKHTGWTTTRSKHHSTCGGSSRSRPS